MNVPGPTGHCPKTPPVMPCKWQADGAVDAARQRYQPVIADQRVAVGAEPVTDCSDRLCLAGGSAYRTQAGPGETQGRAWGSSPASGWEESGRPHPARTVPDLVPPG